MDFVLKKTLKYPQNIEPEKLYQILSAQEDLPSFDKEEWLAALKGLRYPPTKLQLYIEDKEYLGIIEEIYQIILNEPQGISYQDISHKLSNKYKLNQISHYCRKLYNHNLVDITCKSHYKQVKARKYIKATVPFQELIVENHPHDSNYYREFSFISNLFNLISDEGLRLQEIMQFMDKQEESKSFSRLFDLLKDDNCLNKSAERIGKIFTYKYQAKQKVARWPNAHPQSVAQARGTKLVQFDEDVLHELVAHLKPLFPSITLDNDEVARCMNDVLGENSRRKSQISRSKINRFACVCNLIKRKSIVNMKELKIAIADQEQDEKNGTVDNRTIKNYLSILEKIGYCKIRTITAKIVSKECQRLLITHNSVDDNDPKLEEAQEQLKLQFEGGSLPNQISPESSVRGKIEPKSPHLPPYAVKIRTKDQLTTRLMAILVPFFAKHQTSDKRFALIQLAPKGDLQIINEVFSSRNSSTCIGYLLGIEQKVRRPTTQKVADDMDQWESETLALNPLQGVEIKELQPFELSEKQLILYRKFQKSQARQLKPTVEHLKNYLLRYPQQSLAKLHSVFPQLNLYVLLHKLLHDQTIEILGFGSLDEALERQQLDVIQYKITAKFLAYFM